MKYRVANKGDLAEIKNILRQNKLSVDFCDSHINSFVVAENKKKITGVGGVEIYGIYGLVRSIVVIVEWRNQGVGQKILSLLEEKARGEGVATLYLLTETAEDYFSGLGFSVIERAEAPEDITKTRQFSELCPVSAKLMYREIVRN